MGVQDKAASTGADAASSFFARCVVSLGLYWAWTFFSFNPPIASVFPVAALHVTSMVGASASFLAVCLLRHRIAPLCARKTLLVACGVLTAVTTPFYLMPGVPGPVVLAAACVSGAAVALVVCALAEAFVEALGTGEGNEAILQELTRQTMRVQKRRQEEKAHRNNMKHGKK